MNLALPAFDRQIQQPTVDRNTLRLTKVDILCLDILKNRFYIKQVRRTMIMSHVDCLNVSCIRNGPFRFRCYIQYLPEKVARPVIIVSSYRQLSGDGHSEFWTPVRGRLLRVLLSHL